MTSKYFVDQCHNNREGGGGSDQTSNDTVDVDQVRGLFYILGVGIALSFLCLAIQVGVMMNVVVEE